MKPLPDMLAAIVLTGTVVVDGRPFRWWVTDGPGRTLTVSHPVHGTQTQPLVSTPASQARSVSRGMIAQGAACALEQHDDTADHRAAGEDELRMRYESAHAAHRSCTAAMKEAGPEASEQLLERDARARRELSDTRQRYWDALAQIAFVPDGRSH